jgi:hypothetical protein
MTRLTVLDPATLSPYLVQHIDNPVEWHVWGDDALETAERRDVPVLLSVGYSACHWCHVMAHESFEDKTTAAYMNEHFVSIKVDREERPDVDRIYMDAVQAMTGHGGWPMTVFMTPDGRPFFAGTYFPKETRHGHPGFGSILEAISEAWDGRRDDLVEQASHLTAAATQRIPPAPDLPGVAAVDRAADSLIASFDPQHGGFGAAPKFPQAPNLELVIRTLALDPHGERADQLRLVLTTTLDSMAGGGIYDQLGGGFARYAVDQHWLVPHFEKMLYDNALLARVYLRAWQLTGESRYREVAIATLDYLERDMQDPAGGIHAAEDADSEGEEGKFYVWTRAEIEAVLGAEAALISEVYGVTVTGNFEGSNILHRSEELDVVAQRLGIDENELSTRLEAARVVLMRARQKRTRPGRDDKIIAAWNGLAVRSFAEAGAVLGSSVYLEAATRIARFISEHLTAPDGRIMRSWRGGATSVPGFCDDYAAVAVGYLALYQASGDVKWFTAGQQTTAEMIGRFGAENGGFHATEIDSGLVTRPMNLMDNPTPSDNALAAEALQMLGALTGDGDLDTHLEGVFRAAGMLIDQQPGAVGQLIAVMATSLAGIKQVAIVGEPQSRSELAAVVWETFRPECVLAIGDGAGDTVPLLADRGPGSRSLAYVCRHFVCDLPVSDPASLRRQLDERDDDSNRRVPENT